MAEERKTAVRHQVIMEKRENIAATGVIDVISFDEETIIAETEMGVMIISGVNLHVNRLNLESGDLEIDGEIMSLAYEDQNTYTKGKAGSFLSRIFR